ncbi:MAG: phage shock envelope stress response protein PspM [Pseudonocardiaceae bacterium]
MSRRPLTAELMELVGQQARRVVAAVRDPRTKALRRRRRARRAIVLRFGVTLVAGTVTAVIGSSAAVELSEVAAGSVAAVAALGAGMAGARLVRLYRIPLPPPQQAPAAALPPLDSAAREPMVRLAAAEASLADLLAVLERPRHGIAAVPPEALESTRVALAEASAQLRGTAQALRAVERAAAGDTVTDTATGSRAGLVDAVAALRRQLDEGVNEVCGLVAAAGAVVTAADPENRPAALAEATDRLSGLAAGWRELPPRVS